AQSLRAARALAHGRGLPGATPLARVRPIALSGELAQRAHRWGLEAMADKSACVKSPTTRSSSERSRLTCSSVSAGVTWIGPWDVRDLLKRLSKSLMGRGIH